MCVGGGSAGNVRQVDRTMSQAEFDALPADVRASAGYGSGGTSSAAASSNPAAASPILPLAQVAPAARRDPQQAALSPASTRPTPTGQARTTNLTPAIATATRDTDEILMQGTRKKQLLGS